jgi:cation:H+ antiporter
VVYFLYTVFHRESDAVKHIKGKYLPAVIDKVNVVVSQLTGAKDGAVKITAFDIVKLFIGALLLMFGARYLIEAIIHISAIFNIAPGIISITAVAIGTSLPELMVSVKAVTRGHSDMAVGNVFGSNIFNALLVVGIPGMITTLHLDAQTAVLGLSFMAAATLLFVISGMSQRIYAWEGALFLILYGMFMAKLFNLL